MKTTRKALRSEMKTINARIGEIEAAWRKRGMLDSEYNERARLFVRRGEIMRALDSNPLPQIDSLVR